MICIWYIIWKLAWVFNQKQLWNRRWMWTVVDAVLSNWLSIISMYVISQLKRIMRCNLRSRVRHWLKRLSLYSLREKWKRKLNLKHSFALFTETSTCLMSIGFEKQNKLKLTIRKSDDGVAYLSWLSIHWIDVCKGFLSLSLFSYHFMSVFFSQLALEIATWKSFKIDALNMWCGVAVNTCVHINNSCDFCDRFNLNQRHS